MKTPTKEIPVTHFARRPSAALSREAQPILRKEALQAQSADIDVVSGATVTSESYIVSLQGALDRAGR